MSFIPKLKTFVMAKKWYILGVSLTLSLGLGGLYGYNHYKYINSPEYFIAQVNTALLSNDFATLAKLIDFRTLTDEIATKIVRAPIPQQPGKPRETKIEVLSEALQENFMQALLDKDKEPSPEQERDPLAPISPLPPDFAAQLAGNLNMQVAIENDAVFTVDINYPKLQKDFRFIFTATKTDDWRITNLKNFDELLHTYIQEENKLEAAREQRFQKENAKMQERLSRQFQIGSCKAFIHTTSDNTSSLFVQIRGYNKGPNIINNMTFATTVNIVSAYDTLELERNLNMAARILPGVDLQDSYSIILDPSNEQDMIILSAYKISCEAKPFVMTLSNGELLFERKHRFQQLTN